MITKISRAEPYGLTRESLCRCFIGPKKRNQNWTQPTQLDTTFKVCLQKALNQCQWDTVSKLITKINNTSIKDTGRVLQAAILFEQWDVIQACMEHKMSDHLLRAEITSVIDRRMWDMLDTLILQGDNSKALFYGSNMVHRLIEQLLFHPGLRLFLEDNQRAGAVASVVTKDGSTLLHKLCMCRQTLSWFCNYCLTTCWSDTWRNSLMSGLSITLDTQKSDTMKLLLDGGASLDTENAGRKTPIHVTVR